MEALNDSRILRIIPLLIAVCLIGIPTQAKYAGGSGTAEDPYQIATAADLLLLGDSPLDYDKHFILTGDIDLFVRPARENAERILAALNEFGFGSLDLSEDDFATPGKVIQLGVPPVRIDIITKASGVSWEKADAGKVPGCYGQTPVFFISRADFIANKRATGRKKDAADIEAVGEQ